MLGFLASKPNLLFNHKFLLLSLRGLRVTAVLEDLLVPAHAQLSTPPQTNLSQQSLYLLRTLIVRGSKGRLYFIAF